MRAPPRHPLAALSITLLAILCAPDTARADCEAEYSYDFLEGFPEPPNRGALPANAFLLDVGVSDPSVWVDQDGREVPTSLYAITSQGAVPSGVIDFYNLYAFSGVSVGDRLTRMNCFAEYDLCEIDIVEPGVPRADAASIENVTVFHSSVLRNCEPLRGVGFDVKVANGEAAEDYYLMLYIAPTADAIDGEGIGFELLPGMSRYTLTTRYFTEQDEPFCFAARVMDRSGNVGALSQTTCVDPRDRAADYAEGPGARGLGCATSAPYNPSNGTPGALLLGLVFLCRVRYIRRPNTKRLT